MPDPAELAEFLKRRAAELGFSLSGICPAVTPTGRNRFQQWLEAGYAGRMHYLNERREAYEHPRHVLEGVHSLVMVAMPYDSVEPAECEPGFGRVSRYAWGDVDYHDLIRDRLHTLADDFRRLVPEADTRGVVDTAPLLEREFAQLAGLGWVGKNTMLLSRSAGSYFFLAALLTDQLLAYDQPFVEEYCGTCRACLDACPTDAFPQPYVLDATRCISYLTIELQDAIPKELRKPMGDWLFGCDVCQVVCPWNNHSPKTEEQAFYPQTSKNPAELIALFDLDEMQFRARYRRTPLWRAHRRGLLRNAAIVLGNQQHRPALEALCRGLSDEELLVRGACAWALGQLNMPAALEALKTHQQIETNTQVSEEISAALVSENDN